MSYTPRKAAPAGHALRTIASTPSPAQLQPAVDRILKLFSAAGAATSGTCQMPSKAGTERDLPVRGRVRPATPECNATTLTTQTPRKRNPVLGMDFQYALEARGRG